MSSYEDHIWCDVLDIDAAHILLGRYRLYDLDVTSLGSSNIYEFKFNDKKIVLKPAKLKSSVRNNKEITVTEKNDKTSCILVTRTHLSPDLLLLSLLLSLGIPPVFSLFP